MRFEAKKEAEQLAEYFLKLLLKKLYEQIIQHQWLREYPKKRLLGVLIENPHVKVPHFP